MIQGEAAEAQMRAADPDLSTWLSANAGSGKTRVLTDRVARLLLQGVPPERILCLTYTKSAASVMQNRLFKRLGAWAMLPDATLRNELQLLGLPPNLNTAGARRRARTLFARAIETPGGLKIQTIHSFCATLLRRFPLEAGVSPQFTEMEDRDARRLRMDILEDMADGAAMNIIDAVLRHLGGGDLEALAAAVADRREAFAAPMSEVQIMRLLDLPPDDCETRLLNDVFGSGDRRMLLEVAKVFATGKPSDVRQSDILTELAEKPFTTATIELLEGVMLSGAAAKSPFTAKTGSVPTRATQKAMGTLLEPFNTLMRRIEKARPRRLALLQARRVSVLHDFAGAFLSRYAQAKQMQGRLDFDDLILAARRLLTDPATAQWVLFRLDGGIDHILVDEAQDTSPEQWDIVRLLAQEFTTGESARTDIQRTVFVVGDRKQSIYSFQGADPDEFERMRRHFETATRNAGQIFQSCGLTHSFRSAPPILRVVDSTFAEGNRTGLGDGVLHKAFKDDLPGRVDLWPVIEPAEPVERQSWTDPVDLLAPDHHTVRLARCIADHIATTIDTPLPGRNGSRQIRAGDFLILVQSRSTLFQEIIRTCKKKELPVAGADRLKVGTELAVRDLTALLSFLVTPEDSLSLAAVLKSPLFGWDEDALFRLAAGREEAHLWTTLRNRADRHAETCAILHDLLQRTDFLRPYDLLERVLTRHDGRRRLLTRLGSEAEDGIDALLSQALVYEQTEIPSLTGFLGWLANDEATIKRQLDSTGDQIRVMTVHGAKGLEAPIVILPDTAGRRGGANRSKVLGNENGPPLWRCSKSDAPALVRAALEREETREREERQRLLYVAMTRAEQWLIVAAAGDLGKSGDAWYSQIADGMKRADAMEGPKTGGLRLESGDWPMEPKRPAPQDPTPSACADLPAWAMMTAPKRPEPAEILNPSALDGAKALPGDDFGEEAARRHGVYVHTLLERLPDIPRNSWTDEVGLLLPDAEDGERTLALSETQRVLDTPELAPLFASDTLAEVPVTAALPDLGGQVMRGVIDRMIVKDDRVLIVDFKTNHRIPTRAENVPNGLLRQMGAYAHAIEQIFPNKALETAIVWTATATFMVLPRALLRKALRHAAAS